MARLRRFLPFIVLAVGLAVFPVVASTGVVNIGVYALIYGLAAIGLSLLMGLAGQVSLGHAAFFAVGAYTQAILVTKTGVHGAVSAVLAVLASMLLALLVGLPLLRLRGHFLALATLGLGIIVSVVVRELEVTGGTSGIFGIPKPDFNGRVYDSPQEYFWLLVPFVVIGLLLAHTLVRSRTGRALGAVNDSEVAAECLGVNTYALRLRVFVLAAAYAGLAGVFYAHWLAVVSPEAAGFELSVQMLLMVVLGGLGTVWGALTGAVTVEAIDEGTRTLIPSSSPEPPARCSSSGSAWCSSSWSSCSRGALPSCGTASPTAAGSPPRPALWPARTSSRTRSSPPPHRWAPAPQVPTAPARSDRGLGVVAGRRPGARGDTAGARRTERRLARPVRPRHTGREAFAALLGQAGTRPGSALLSVNGLTKRYGGVKALDDLGFEVRAGEILALIGPNGAGKTTAFNVITGVLEPTSGTVTLRGKEVQGRRPHTVAALGATRTFQNLQVFGSSTVLGNVKVARHLRSRSGIVRGMLGLSGREEREIEQSARTAVEALGLGADADRPVTDLSFGQQRKVEVARALALAPALLLLDEPMAGLSGPERDSLAWLLRKVREAGSPSCSSSTMWTP